MNTVSRFNIINSLISENGYSKYLEIGFQQGICYNEIKCAYKKAVDPSPVNTNCDNLFLGTSDEFFAQNTEMFDIGFIDGLHTYEQVKKDFNNLIRFINPNGRIVLHDMNPSSEERAKSFAEGGLWNGDCYKLALDLFSGVYKYKYYTIDEDNGCMIVNPNKTDESIPLNTQIDYSYSFFDKNRVDILNLKKW